MREESLSAEPIYYVRKKSLTRSQTFPDDFKDHLQSSHDMFNAVLRKMSQLRVCHKTL